jgi:predicted porin
MKKTLIAVAALAATGAFAQSSVTIGGNLDLAYGTTVFKSDTGLKDKMTGVHEGYLKPNNIYFRGEEALGGGLTAGFMLDQGLAPTQTNGTSVRAFNDANALQAPGGNAFTTSTMRAGNVYVKGGFGEVRLGMQNRAGYGVTSRTIVLAENTGGLGHTLASTRTNAVSYTSPAFSGVTAQVQYGSAQGLHNEQQIQSAATNASGYLTDNTKVIGASLNYNQGPLWVGVAYEYTDIKRVASAAVTAPANSYGGAVAAGTNANYDQKLWALAGSYDFGVAKIIGAYVKYDQDGTTLSTAHTS